MIKSLVLYLVLGCYFTIKVNASFKIFGRYFYLKVFSSLLRLLRNFSSSVIEFYQILCESLNIHIFPIILFMNINEIFYKLSLN